MRSGCVEDNGPILCIWALISPSISRRLRPAVQLYLRLLKWSLECRGLPKPLHDIEILYGATGCAFN
jgi:hypothetical protein